ncbi:3-dehydroquinate synthase [Sphingomonas oryzagri]|uniref:3-dehydroquinate synthase family protein n=1 Tax=Sphingomonas oryzagri TaxID=3042314 RepID=A0ABT6N438_9SPHN|nr:3-dehydroquinate synthase family protein [Sphingomonas oryzagri]MDH7639927.1 3-dehydroquinate synthase family protein [Sphingomonas oryzagri]
MPTSFSVSASTGAYDVAIGPGSLAAVLADTRDQVVIADAFFADRLAAAGIDAILIDANEEAKSLDRVSDLIVALRERGATRGTRLVAIGGGVVQDAAAFVASIYMRGIDWVYVPTTLLSMADSCIGGKSSINVGRFKNIVGTFHPPVTVQVDATLTDKLSAEQKAEGLCEAAKICLCHGPDRFADYLALAPSAMSGAATLERVSELTLRTKTWFIEIDEFDRAERLLLNFGHTFGHAIEAASDFAVSHGLAVGLGMLAALELGRLQGRDPMPVGHVAAFAAHIRGLLATVPDLADRLSGVTIDAFFAAFESDKKHSRTAYAAIVVTPEGRVERVMLPRDAASVALIRGAFAAILEASVAARAAA